MTKRKIVQIDEEKCTGCALCIPNCAEGALQIVDGKARLVKDIYCDGLGACLGTCPEDAITIIEREAEDFDEEAVEEHLENIKEEIIDELPKPVKEAQACNCPSMQIKEFEENTENEGDFAHISSTLRQWPVQLHLVPPSAPFLQNKELLIAADCVPFATANFHQDYLKDKSLLIGCPKLDDAAFYIDKLAQIFQVNNIPKITVLHMEVPCCFGLNHIVKEALVKSGKNIPIDDINISVQGEELQRTSDIRHRTSVT